MREAKGSAASGSLEPHVDPLHGTPYRAIGALGFGGMGEVLEAEHRGLRKRVVVKLLRAELADDARFVDRLRVEAQALAAISHPNIVSVTDLGETPTGRPYMVTELLHGCTLRQVLARDGALPVARAIDIARQLLAALGAAHRIGVVHRDVKPDNIFVCDPVGRAPSVVKLLDFGVAKVIAAEGAPGAVAGPVCPTEEGMVVGTLRWLAPEQLRFHPVDARADLFGVGLVLYTMLTGRDPYAHLRGRAELLNAQLHVDPDPPSRHAPQVIAPELDAAVQRALAKDPGRRFPDAEVFALELDRIAGALAPLAPGSEPPLAPAAGTDSRATSRPPATLLDEARTLVSPRVEPPPDGTSSEPDPFADENTRRQPREVAIVADGVPVASRGDGPLRAPPALDPLTGDQTSRQASETAAVLDALPVASRGDEKSAGFTRRPAAHARRDVTVLTVASALFFSVVIALVFRYFGVH